MSKLLLYLFLFTLFSVSVSAVTNTGLMRCYSFDTTPVDSTGNFDGVIFGAVTNETGQVNGAYGFNAAPYIKIDDVFSGLTNFSLSFWGYRVVDSGTWERWFMNFDGSYHFFVNIFDTDDKLFWATFDSSDHGNFKTSGAIPVGSWNHYVLVRSSNGDTMYVNGVNDSSNSYSASGLRSSGVFTIGGGADGFAGNKRFDEVMIFNRTLLAGDVSDLFANFSCSDFAPPTPLFILNSSLNMTSDGGCIAWRDDKSNVCNTTDSTPTIVFSTSLVANCSIDDNAHSYNSSKDCSTTGGTSQICTIFADDALSVGLNNVTASCVSGAETDTTGPMAINLSVPNTPPVVVLNLPLNDSSTFDVTPIFTFNYSDAELEAGDCELFIVDTAIQGYTGFNFSVTTQETSPKGLAFDGTNFYIVGNFNDIVYEYNISGVYTGFNFSVTTQDETPSGLAFDGTNFYMTGTSANKVWEYNISGVYTGFNFSVASQDGAPTGLAFDGTNFYIVGVDTDTVYEYNISGVYTGFNFLVTSQDETPSGLAFDETDFYIVGDNTNTVYEYNFSGNYTGFGTVSGVVSGTNNQSITANASLSVGTHNWFVNCSDGTDTTQSGGFDITILNTPPVVVLNLPVNGSSTSDSTPIFTFNYSDLNSEQSGSCELFVNLTGFGEVSGVASGSNNVSITANVSLSVGGYSWFVNCSDGFDTAVSGGYDITIGSTDESLESTFFLEQGANITLTGTGWKTVMTADFNVSVDNTSLYVGATSSMVTSGTGSYECRLLFDDIDSFNSNVVRSFTGGSLGSLYLLSDSFVKNVSSVNVKYQCMRLTGGLSAVVSNTKLVGHLLVDEFNRSINFVAFNVTGSTSSSSFSLLDSFIFNVSSLFGAEGVVNSLVVNWRAVYNNTGGSGEELNSLISINGSNCASYPRFVGGSSTGIVGGDCVFIDVPANDNLNVSVFGSGSAASFDFKLFVKQLFTHAPQVNSTFLNGTSVSSSGLVDLINFSTGNIDHANANLFVKAGIPFFSNSGSTTGIFMFALSNGLNSSVSSRDVDVNESGVLIMQHVFEGLSVGNYTVSLFGGCGNSDCSLVGGEVVAYVTNVITIIFNSFNVSVVDDYNGSAIQVFNVTTSGGLVFTAVDGSVIVFSPNALENLTVKRDNYINRSVVGHNTSGDMNTTIWQSVISFEAFAKATIGQIFNFSVNDSVKNDSTVNGTAVLKLSVGNHSVDWNNTIGWFNSSAVFEVLPLDVKTVNFSGLFNSQVNITGLNFTLGASSSLVNNLSGNVSFTINFSEDFSTSGFNIVLNLTAGVTYDFFLTSRPNFTFDNSRNFGELLVVVGFQEFNLTIPRDQSILATFRDSVNNNELSNVTVTLVGPTNVSFDNLDGEMFVFNLTVGNYTVFISKTNYNTFSDTITISDGSLVELNIFMDNVSNPVDFIVQNVFGSFIEAASVVITRASDDAVIGTESTDIFGGVTFNLNPIIVYNINVSKSGFDPFFGTLNAFQSEYFITLTTSEVSKQFFISLDYEFLPVTGTPIINDTVFNFTFNVSSSVWDLTRCTFSLLNGSFSGNVLASNSSFCSVTGGFAFLNVSTSGLSVIIASAELELNSTNNVTVYRFYNVRDFFQGEFSLMTVVDDLKSFAKAGFTSSTLFFLVVLGIIGLTVALGSALSVFGEPEKMLLFATVLTGAASVAGLLTVTFTPVLFPEAGQFIIFIVMGLLTIASFISSGNWRLS